MTTIRKGSSLIVSNQIVQDGLCPYVAGASGLLPSGDWYKKAKEKDINSRMIIHIILGLFIFVFITLQEASAESMTFTTDTIIASDEAIAEGEIWTIESGVTLSISPSANITIERGGAIVNNGSIENHGSIVSHSIIDNYGTIENHRSIIGFIDSNFVNDGVIVNHGSIINEGFFGNGGAIENETGGDIANARDFLNFGVITNNGGVRNLDIFENTGAIENNGNMENGENRFFRNNGAIVNNGAINNDGIFANFGNIRNFGALRNFAPSGAFRNSGVIENHDVIGNSGVIENDGAIENHRDGAIENVGDIVNNDRGAIQNLGVIENNNNGAIENFGDIVNSGVINDRCGEFVGEIPTAGDPVVDRCAPQTTINTTPSNPTNNNTPSFTFSGTDASGIAGFECSIDNRTFESCISGDFFGPLADGSHAFRVRAIDNAGNIDTSPALFSWIVDTTPPEMTIDSATDGVGINLLFKEPPTSPSDSLEFTFSADDGLGTGISGFECRLNNATFTPCSSPQMYSGLDLGSYTFSIRAVDKAGNISTTPVLFEWTIQSPSEAINELIQDILEAGYANKVEKSLVAPLKQASPILEDGNPNNDGAACDKLGEFISNLNEKESSGQLKPEDADDFETRAWGIQTAIGCPAS